MLRVSAEAFESRTLSSVYKSLTFKLLVVNEAIANDIQNSDKCDG